VGAWGSQSGLCVTCLSSHEADIRAKTNVLVDSQCRARIADFGQTSSLRSTGMGSLTPQSGTAAYMAPELLDPDHDDDFRKASTQSDIYALGMLTWEVRLACFRKHRVLIMVTQVHAGVSPFKGTPDLSIPLKTMMGRRPLRRDARRLVVKPELDDDVVVARKDHVWRMIEGCWNQHAEQRPRLVDIKRMFEQM
jgi:serine/threonine protein kinase